MLNKIKLILKKLINNWLLIFILILTGLIFGQSLNNYFGGDDWFHLNVSQIKNFSEFLNFFNPLPNPQMTAFYRPLPNQFFFFINQNLFGLQAFFYHLPIYLMFLGTIYLFYQLLNKLNFAQKEVNLATIFYALSATHFTQLYFISANQEIMMVFFVLLYLLWSLKGRKIWAQIFLILALLSKDTAVVAPIILLIIKLIEGKISCKKINIEWLKKFYQQNYSLLISGVLVLIYLYIRFFLFHSPGLEDSSYQLNFSPKSMLNSFYFYFWWLLGAPELIQDYMSKIYAFLPRFFADFTLQGKLIISLGLLFLLILGIIFLRNWRKIWSLENGQKNLYGLTFLLLGLLPVIFLPQHKFTIQLGLPMLGMAILLSLIVAKARRKWLTIFATVLFLIFNFTTVKMTEKTHYSLQRSKIAQKVATYFNNFYPQLPAGQVVYIVNAETTGSEIKTWGSSKQVAYALWHENFIQAFYHDKTLQMKFEDLEPLLIEEASTTAIILPASLFL